MPPTKIDDNAAYQRYKALSERPLGMFAFSQNDEGTYVVLSGELFCRKNVMSDEEAVEAQINGQKAFRLCDQKGRFSHTGNLRAHLTGSHKLKLAEVRKGTNSAEHVRQAARFFETTMRNHDSHLAAQARGEELDEFLETPEPQTPQKAKPVIPAIPRRPEVPTKKDGTINKSKMKQMSTVTHKCNMCRTLKRKICPPTQRVPCEVWDYFTEDEEEEEEAQVISSDSSSESSMLSDAQSQISGDVFSGN